MWRRIPPPRSLHCRMCRPNPLLISNILVHRLHWSPRVLWRNAEALSRVSVQCNVCNVMYCGVMPKHCHGCRFNQHQQSPTSVATAPSPSHHPQVLEFTLCSKPAMNSMYVQCRRTQHWCYLLCFFFLLSTHSRSAPKIENCG